MARESSTNGNKKAINVTTQLSVMGTVCESMAILCDFMRNAANARVEQPFIPISGPRAVTRQTTCEYLSETSSYMVP